MPDDTYFYDLIYYKLSLGAIESVLPLESKKRNYISTLYQVYRGPGRDCDA